MNELSCSNRQFRCQSHPKQCILSWTVLKKNPMNSSSRVYFPLFVKYRKHMPLSKLGYYALTCWNVKGPAKGGLELWGAEQISSSELNLLLPKNMSMHGQWQFWKWQPMCKIKLDLGPSITGEPVKGMFPLLSQQSRHAALQARQLLGEALGEGALLRVLEHCG